MRNGDDLLKKILICVLVFVAVFTSSAIAGERAFNWYCKHSGGEKPALDPEMSFISDHGGYYLDENASADDKVIYLTFDAGYENGNIAKILDTLKKHKAKAAFFVLGHLIEANTDLVFRMANEGHLVCNHTADHKDMTEMTSYDFAAELQKLNDIYYQYTGLQAAKYYRPPEGRFTERNLEYAEQAGYKTIFWSFAYADWDNDNQPDKEAAKEKILSNTHNGEVILLHPTSQTNAEILDYLLSEWESKGYRFGTLDELCGSGADK